MKRPLIVTDPYIRGCGIFDRATGLLDHARIRWSVFSETVADPTTAVVEAGAGFWPRAGSTAWWRSAAAARSIPPKE